MARYNFLGRAVDTYGNAQSNTSITIYLTGTTTAATVYTSRTGGTGISTAPQITTDSYGNFNFYVDDADYNASQKYDIVAAGLTYEDIEIMRGATDHGGLEGLSDDDHTQYAALAQDESVTGRWTFSFPLSGETPTIDNQLATKAYVDSIDTSNDALISDMDSKLDAHLASAGVHFTEASIDHTAIQNVGTNTHSQIDTHIASTEALISDMDSVMDSHLASAVHYSEDGIEDIVDGLLTAGANIVLTYNDGAGTLEISGSYGVGDHVDLYNVGSNTHAQIDDRIADLRSHLASAGVHFTEASIDHTAIQNVGSNTHAQIDTHISSAETLISDMDAALDSHLASAAVHHTQNDIEEIVNTLLQEGPNITLTWNSSGGESDPITFNPNDKNATLVLSNGNLSVADPGGASAKGVRCTEALPATGKYYWEYKINSKTSQNHCIGIADTTFPLTAHIGDSATGNGWGYHTAGRKYHNGSYTSGLATASENDIIGVAIDCTTGKWWAAVNNTWVGSGNPAGGTNQLHTIDATVYPAISLFGASHDGTIRFLEESWTYTAPAGFSEFESATGGSVASNTLEISGAHPVTASELDHTELQNIGSNTHAQIDDRIADLRSHLASAGVHFTEASIDHTAIQNVGSNTHAQIDTHISSAEALISDMDSAMDAHLASAGVHYTEIGTEDIVDGLLTAGANINLSYTQGGSINYDTFNPSDKSSAITLSNGNLVATKTAAGTAHKAVRSILSKSSGKYYVEFEVTNATDNFNFIGLAQSDANIESYVGSDTNAWGYNGAGYKWYNGSGTNVTLGFTDNGVRAHLAVDIDAGKIWFGRGNSWVESGDPANGSNEQFSGLSGPLYLMVSLYNQNSAIRVYTDPSNYDYSAPTGFTAGWSSGSSSGSLTISGAHPLSNSEIDHTNIQNVGSNTHAQIDTHISSAEALISDMDSKLDSHLASAGVHESNKIREGNSGVVVNDTGTGSITISADGAVVSQFTSGAVQHTGGVGINRAPGDYGLAVQDDDGILIESEDQTKAIGIKNIDTTDTKITLELRERKKYASYSPDTSFSKVGNGLYVINTVASLGESIVFAVFDTSYLDGKKIKITWSGDQDTDVTKVGVYDGEYNRETDGDWSLQNNSTWYQKGNGELQALITKNAVTAWDETVTSSVLDLSGAAENKVTLAIWQGDAHNILQCYFTITELQILDASEAELKSVDFTSGSVTMEQTGTTGDYGYFGASEQTYGEIVFYDDPTQTVGTLQIALNKDNFDFGSTTGAIGALTLAIGDSSNSGTFYLNGIDFGSIVSDIDSAMDAHLASAGVHFTEASIDHTNIQNIGTNTHAQIDTHISTAEALISDMDSVMDSHLASAGVHESNKIREGNSGITVNDTGTGEIIASADGATIFLARTSSSLPQFCIGDYTSGLLGIKSSFSDTNWSGISIDLDPTGTLTGSKTHYGHKLDIDTTNLDPDGKGYDVYGIYNIINANQADDLYGQYNQVSLNKPVKNTTTGFANYVLLYADVPEAYGVHNIVWTGCNPSAATFPAVYGTHNDIRTYNGKDTITNAYGSYNNFYTSGTITNAYFVYGNYMGSPGTFGTKWGAYFTGEDKSYFSGNVGIGETTPGATLDVNGDLILQNGTAIDEFSTDTTLGGDSDLAVPTEKAVKAYVDSAVVTQEEVEDYVNGLLVAGNNIVLTYDDGAGSLEISAAHPGAGGGVTDHTELTSIGTNTHAQIDTHISDSSIHFEEALVADIDSKLDSHLTSAGVHFTEESIDHTAIQNIGTNSHADIDTHITNTASYGGLISDMDSVMDSHLASGSGEHHVQNTDTGTSSTTFDIGPSGYFEQGIGPSGGPQPSGSAQLSWHGEFYATKVYNAVWG